RRPAAARRGRVLPRRPDRPFHRRRGRRAHRPREVGAGLRRRRPHRSRSRSRRRHLVAALHQGGGARSAPRRGRAGGRAAGSDGVSPRPHAKPVQAPQDKAGWSPHLGRATMRHLTSGLIGLVLLTGALAPPAMAADAAAAATDYAELDAQEARDGETVQRILVGGFKAMARERQTLIEIVDRAPKSYPQIEVRGDKIITRAIFPEDSHGLWFAASAIESTNRKKADPAAKVSLTLENRFN